MFFGQTADLFGMAEELVDRELMLNRFKRLLGELIRGDIGRNSFQPWEIRIILDFREVQLPSKRRTEILRQYERAVTRQMQYEDGPPMTLSEFVVIRDRRREAMRSEVPGVLPPETVQTEQFG